MKIDDLLLLADVQRAGSLSGAARTLELPKATLSRRLSGLEAAVGTRLFVPGARRLKLTDFGQQLAERAARHREDLDETRQWIGANDSTPRGRLRIAAPAELATLLLAEAMARFVERWPAVQLEIDTTPRRVDLNNEPYDLALYVGPLEDSPWIARPLMMLERGLYAAPRYLAEHPPPRTPATLDQHRFVLLTQAQGFVQRLQRGRKRVEVKPAGALSCNAIGLVLAMVRAGGGLASLPHGMARSEVLSGNLVPVLPEWNLEPLPVTLLTASRRLMPAKTRAFIDHVLAHLPGWAAANQR